MRPSRMWQRKLDVAGDMLVGNAMPLRTGASPADPVCDVSLLPMRGAKRALPQPHSAGSARTAHSTRPSGGLRCPFDFVTHRVFDPFLTAFARAYFGSARMRRLVDGSGMTAKSCAARSSACPRSRARVRRRLPPLGWDDQEGGSMWFEGYAVLEVKPAGRPAHASRGTTGSYDRLRKPDASSAAT